MDKKRKHKVHLGSSAGTYPKSACGIAYPHFHTPFLKFIDCKRCKATYEYRANIGAEKDIAYEEGK